MPAASRNAETDGCERFSMRRAMLTRYKGQLKLKDWAFAIARRSTMRKARVALARRLATMLVHAMLRRRNGVRVGVSPRNPPDRRPHPAPAEERRPREGADDGADCVACGQSTGRLRFQPSRPAPSLPHQVPNEHAENTGTRKRRPPGRASALDPVENSIRRLQPSGERN